MDTISLKLPESLLAATTRVAESLGLSRSDCVRRAVDEANRRARAELAARRMAEASRRVRDESMRVNAEFEAVERDPDA